MPTRSSTFRSRRSCGWRGTPRWWRSARRGSTTSTTTARPAAQAEGFRKHIAAARATQLPLVIHTRDADEDTAAILEEETRQGRVPGRAALLHGRGGARQARAGARPLRVVLRHPHLQEVGCAARHRRRRAARPAAGRDRRAVPGARQVPRQEQRAGLRRHHGGGAGQGEGRVAGGAGAAPRPRTSFACTARRRARRWPHELCASRSWAAAHRAACRASATCGARAIRPTRRTGGGAARCWSSGSARADVRRCWSTPRPISASSCSMRASRRWTACCSRTTTPTIRTASTICAGIFFMMRRRVDV